MPFRLWRSPSWPGWGPAPSCRLQPTGWRPRPCSSGAEMDRVAVFFAWSSALLSDSDSEDTDSEDTEPARGSVLVTAREAAGGKVLPGGEVQPGGEVLAGGKVLPGGEVQAGGPKDGDLDAWEDDRDSREA
jgi:hypothetical protein